MPAYDFRCTDCQNVCEVTRPAGVSDLVVCPECGGDTKRVFSPVGVVFKGSGFHNTDYRSTPKEKSDDKSDDSGGCPASDSTSDACAGCPASGDSD